MGFFFHESAKFKKASKEPPVKLLRLSGCKACSLNKVETSIGKLQPSGSEKPLVYVVGDFPRHDVDTKDEHFVKKFGKYFKDAFFLRFGSSLRDAVRFGNVLQCELPKTSISTSTEIECCRRFLELDIEKTKPVAILGLGEVPLRWFLDVSGVRDLWRGRRIPIKIGSHVCWFFPILHPSYVVAENSRRSYGESEWEKCFQFDLKNIYDFLMGDNYEDPIVVDSDHFANVDLIFGKEYAKDCKRVEIALQRLSKEKEVGLDIENWPLKPWGSKDKKLLSIAIGTENYTVAYPLERSDAWEGRYDTIFRLTKEFLLNSGIKVTHTLKHELTWLNAYFGESVLRETQWRDIKSQAYVLDTRTSKKRGQGMFGLGRLTQLHLGFNIKKLSSVSVVDLRESPIEALLRYNAGDARFLCKIHSMQDKRMTKAIRDVYLRHHVEASKTLALVETEGVSVDLAAMNQLEFGGNGQKGWADKFKEVSFAIQERPEVKEYKKRTGKELNPGSDLQLAVVFEKILNLPCKKRTNSKSTSSGRYSVDKFVLEDFEKAGVALAPLVSSYRMYRDLISTYCEGVKKRLDFNNVLHTEYNHEHTDTGRLASENPNLQNWDKRKNPQVRRIIVA